MECTLLLEAAGLRLFPWEQGGGEEGMLWVSSGLSALGDGQWEKESLASAFPGVKGRSWRPALGMGCCPGVSEARALRHSLVKTRFCSMILLCTQAWLMHTVGRG